MTLLARSAAFTLVLALTPACAHRGEDSTEVPAPVVDEIRSPADYAIVLNEYALLAADRSDHGDRQAPTKRLALREKLLAYLLAEASAKLADGAPEEAVARLEHVAALFAPSELRGELRDPRIASVARELYSAAARSGHEMPALFTLAMQWQFGDDRDRRRADADWLTLADWLDHGGEYATEPGLAEDPEQLLEQAAAVFPSPWLNDKLVEIYVSRYLAHRGTRGRRLGAEPDPRVEFTGYLLARLYLRADAPEAAVAVLDRIELDRPTKALRELLVGLTKNPGAGEVVELIAYFEPTAEGHLPPAVVTQGWGIVGQLARRGLAIAPDDPRLHLAMARSFVQSGLTRAAVVHYEAALAGEPEEFAIWAELAIAYQMAIEQEAERDAKLAAARLARIEAFHARASERWRDRPISPGVGVAQVTVAAALFDAGEAAAARKILIASSKVEPLPEALDILGRIAMKLGEFDVARRQYEALIELPFEDQYMRLDWEIRAHEQLVRIAVTQGDQRLATQHLQAELRQLNTILAIPLAEPDLAARLVQRCVVFLYLGEMETAMADFHRAASTMPDEAGVYADPMLFAVSHGNLDEAVQIYRRAVVREGLDADLRLYFSLWVQDLSIRQRGERLAEASRFIDGYEGGRWQMLLAQHARARISFDDLLAQATDKGERAEAYFYEALRVWSQGRRDASLEFMSRVVETGMVSFFEYEMAQHYLHWHELPETARTPIDE